MWAEVDEGTFERYIAIFNEDATDEPAERGLLANDIAGYDDASREPVMIRFGTSDARPNLHLAFDSTSSLARDQRNGISNHRYYEMLRAWGPI